MRAAAAAFEQRSYKLKKDKKWRSYNLDKVFATKNVFRIVSNRELFTVYPEVLSDNFVVPECRSGWSSASNVTLFCAKSFYSHIGRRLRHHEGLWKLFYSIEINFKSFRGDGDAHSSSRLNWRHVFA